VDNNAPTEQLTIKDLQPATWYQLRITSHNDAGSTRAHFSFATTTITGGILFITLGMGYDYISWY
jgi:hypothetical protein